jgi:hypothetical protein
LPRLDVSLIWFLQFDDSAIVEECLVTIAARQPTTRFVKMHQDIADMDHIKAPALLAYRGGDVFATIVDVLRNIPRGRSCSADSLEDLLKLCVSRALVHSPLKLLLMTIPDTVCYDTSFAIMFSAVHIYKHSSKASWLFLRDLLCMIYLT